MQKPFTRESTQRLRRRMVYHIAQLEAEPAHAGMLAANRTLLERLDAFSDAGRGVSDGVTRAMAVRARSDRRADEAIRAFDLALLGLIDRDREDPRYVIAYQERNMTETLRLPFKKQAKAMRHIAAQMDEGRPLAALADPHQEALREAAEALAGADEALKQALDARAARSTERTLLRLDVTRVLEKDYAALLQITPHDEDEVELYFYAFPRGGGEAVDEEEDDI